MPTNASAVLSVIRLQRPAFRTKGDRLAFAVHAYVLAQGYKLVATGSGTDGTATQLDWAADREEVGAEGWDSLPGGFYAFRYQDAEARGRPPLYLKCIAAGAQLLVQWLTNGAGGGSEAAHGLQLDCEKYATDEPAAPGAYKNVEGLVKELDATLGRAVGLIAAAAAAAPVAAAPAAHSQAAAEEEYFGEPEPSRGDLGGYSPLQEGPPRRGGGGGGVGGIPVGILPTGVGYEDVAPPGVRPPGFVGPGHGGGGVPGMIGPGPPHMGGGMVVGPGHPMFGRGKLGEGVGPGHGGLPPPGTARWDPIAPPGMRGFRPDDYQRQQQQRDPSRPHPDIAQPGPREGTDWDSFYG